MKRLHARVSVEDLAARRPLQFSLPAEAPCCGAKGAAA